MQDVENKKIEYRDAVVDIYGVPVAYFPFLAHPDPSVRRASGILIPNMGYPTHLGAFFALPYYWVIDGQSDATITPVLSAKQGGGLEVEYRHVFNDGKITLRRRGGQRRGRRRPATCSPAATSRSTTPGAGASTSTAPAASTSCATT